VQEAPAAADLAAQRSDVGAASTVRLFASTVEPLTLGLLGSGHFVLFRAVHQGGARIIQGLLIEQGPFLAGLMGEPFQATGLALTTDLIVAFRDEVLAAFRARQERGSISSVRELSGALLYRTRPREPFGGLELIFSVGRLPVPPGAAVIGWVAGLLTLVLVAGTWFMDRLGQQQIGLVRQQQAFVSAVSHELKTPLTSIRLYAELLRTGFADADRRQVYYRYIQEESERLSRLIANVLTLSRIDRDALSVSPAAVPLTTLMDLVLERVTAQVERAGFALVLECEAPGLVQADPDAFVQILINLVDNALKFAAQAEPKIVEIRCVCPRAGWVRVAVRDFGPGVPRAALRQVFQLFYRGEDAARRAIPGTGIGLALVERLLQAMGGRVEVVNREPGAEFRVELPAAPDAEHPGQPG
jgi:signal transduction histidine kinase